MTEPLLPIRGSSGRSPVRGCNGPSANPLRPASRSTSPLQVEELGRRIAPLRGSCRRSRLRGRNGGSTIRESERARGPSAPRPGIPSLRKDLVFLGRDDLAALVHAGLQVDVVRALQFAGFLVLDIAVGPQGVMRAAHVAARGGGFSLRNGHGRLSLADRGRTAAETGARRGGRLCPNRAGDSSRCPGSRHMRRRCL